MSNRKRGKGARGSDALTREEGSERNGVPRHFSRVKRRSTIARSLKSRSNGAQSQLLAGGETRARRPHCDRKGVADSSSFVMGAKIRNPSVELRFLPLLFLLSALRRACEPKIYGANGPSNSAYLRLFAALAGCWPSKVDGVQSKRGSDEKRVGKRARVVQLGRRLFRANEKCIADGFGDGARRQFCPAQSCPGRVSVIYESFRLPHRRDGRRGARSPDEEDSLAGKVKRGQNDGDSVCVTRLVAATWCETERERNRRRSIIK